MDRVHHQVEQDLVELIPYGEEFRGIGGALHHEFHLRSVGLALKEQRSLTYELA